ncbi:MAG: 1-acyl-sn-glycerol-3-phosphate acyltransferase [Candidatus Rokubacteria bacterium]|nr:1-acyl-sn-glycerol-3-phosphate acyltransferase [Candidatus Rokubacteria bacterium]
MRTPVLDLFRPAVWLGARLYFGIRFEGVDNIPRDGGLIITPNHVTYADPPLVTIPVRRPVHYMAWSALFRIPVLSSLIRRLRAFPVEIEAADPKATRETVRLLDAGAAVMIFPEAGRSPDGRLQRFRPGAFRLACSCKVPVLPVTIIGGTDSWPPGRWLPRPGRLTIVYHPLIWPAGGKDVKGAAQEMARNVRAAVVSALPLPLRPADEE